MADSIAGTYAVFAGVEIINDVRTLTYLKNGLGPGSINVYGSCGCDNLVEILSTEDCPVTGYSDPITDDAPWYSADHPESAEFLGFVVDEFDGLSSTFNRNVRQLITNGGVLTRSRLGTRELTWRGFLFGATCCATQYGLRWLAKNLAQFNPSCADCAGDDLQLLVCCPENEEQVRALRLLKGVGLLEGPTIISERKTCSSGCEYGCGGSCILEVEFTLVAAQPFLYEDPIPLYECIPLSEGIFVPVVNPDEVCPPFDCGQETLQANIPDCVPELPPTATYQNPCFEDLEASLGPALYLTVPRGSWSELDEIVPVITIINNGQLFDQGVQLGFYRSESDDPCGDLFLNPPGCDVLCDELLIGPLPPNSDFYIDGRTRRMSVICADGTAFAGEKLTNGPWSWPTFTNFGFCMEVRFVNTQPVNFVVAPEICISLSLVPRTF